MISTAKLLLDTWAVCAFCRRTAGKEPTRGGANAGMTCMMEPAICKSLKMCVWTLNKRGRQSRELWSSAQRNAMVLFSLSVSLAISLGLALYRVAVGSMTEPSELGGAISVAVRILRCTVTRFSFSISCPGVAPPRD